MACSNMTSKIILVDLDGPLTNLEDEFLRQWREKFPNEFYIPFEQRKTFFLNDEYPEHLRKDVASIIATENFFTGLPPIMAGVNAVKEIAGLGNKVIICTSDIYTNTTGLTDKRIWVQKYLGHDFAKTMIFTRDKTLVRGDYLIDDKPEITGLLFPSWKHILFDQPFNRHIIDKVRMNIDWSNWKEVIV